MSNESVFWCVTHIFKKDVTKVTHIPRQSVKNSKLLWLRIKNRWSNIEFYADSNRFRKSENKGGRQQ